ncbi:hypothetical protein BpHYR1_052788 [Brachionus plicatilis]|uniref:Uncharacterized protein n=1 Tax=Brachionus plicatilis TaxID=10195 RepID=A0A3M7T139_BRAPC|nr:hypothetical protein BpHYR1_052788 [Brachionus plicatilis]
MKMFNLNYLKRIRGTKRSIFDDFIILNYINIFNCNLFDFHYVSGLMNWLGIITKKSNVNYELTTYYIKHKKNSPSFANKIKSNIKVYLISQLDCNQTLIKIIIKFQFISRYAFKSLRRTHFE